MKALLIDDEPLARRELRRLLATHRTIEIVGEAADADEAAAAICQLLPELLFLDINLPEKNGFELLATFKGALPAVIFTTAYDEHALRAFEIGAVDYLVKPIEPERLAAAIRRAERRVVPGGPGPTAGGTTANDEPEEPSLSPTGGPLSCGEKVFVRDGDRCWFVPVEAIRGMEAEGNHTRLWLPGAEPLVNRTLQQLEERLPAELFFRANRAQLINLQCVERVDPWFSGSLRLVIAGKEVELSRRQSRQFRARLQL